MAGIFFEDLEKIVRTNNEDFARVLPVGSSKTHIMTYSLRPSFIFDHNEKISFVHFLYFVSGTGKLATSRVKSRAENVYIIRPGMCAVIPQDLYFQVQNKGNSYLKFLAIMIPPERHPEKYR